MNIKRILTLVLLIGVIVGCKGKSVGPLLEEGEVEAAVRRCEKMEPEQRTGCYGTIAAYYLKEDQFKEAAVYYARAGDHAQVINSYFRADLIAEAEKYCAGQVGPARQQCAARLGRKFFINGNYNRAIHYYMMAGDSEKVSYIEVRIPLFQLVERIARELTAAQDPQVHDRIEGIKETLNEYIYMDKYVHWPYKSQSKAGQRAAAVFELALTRLTAQSVPTLVRKLHSPSFDWSTKSVDAVSFDRVKLQSLIGLITSLHRMAGKRQFFGKFSAPSEPLAYDGALLKALDHAGGLLKTIEEAEGVTNKEWAADYQYNMDIDIRAIDYIAAMMDNIKKRIEDIQARSRRLQNSSQDTVTKEIAAKLFRDFLAQCRRVFQAIGQEEFPQANDLLLDAYKTAKTGLDQYTNRD